MVTKDEALKLALEALEFIPESGSMLGAHAEEKRINAIAAIKRTLAAPVQEPHNFCPRCGKRLEGVLGRPQMHTCTPPLWGHT